MSQGWIAHGFLVLPIVHAKPIMPRTAPDEHSMGLFKPVHVGIHLTCAVVLTAR
jgi:hypothetical protein